MEPVTLPKDLQEAQERINQFYKDERLKQQIGKYYVAYKGEGSPVALRRIYMDKDKNIKVEQYEISKYTEEVQYFNYKSWTITEFLDTAPHGFSFSEIEGKYWYQSFQRFLNINALKIGVEQMASAK